MGKAMRWDYNVSLVAPMYLMTRLGQLGNDGWEVVSMTLMPDGNWTVLAKNPKDDEVH